MKYLLLSLSLLLCSYVRAQQTLYRYFDKHWGVTNEKKEIVVTPEYDDVELTLFPYIKVGKDFRYGIADTKGKLIVPCNFNKVKVLRRDMAYVKVANGLQLLRLPSGKMDSLLVFNDLGDVYYGKEPLIVVENKDKKMGVFNTRTGKMQLNFQYESCYFLDDTTKPLLKVRLAEPRVYRLINALTGKEILPIDMKYVRTVWYEQKSLIEATTEKNEVSYYDTDGKLFVLANPALLRTKPISDGNMPLLQEVEYLGAPTYTRIGGDRWKIWRPNNKDTAILEGYSDLSDKLESSSYVLATKNGKKGLLNLDGKIVLPISYDDISKTTYIIPSQQTNEYYTTTTQEQLKGLLNGNPLKEIKKPMFTTLICTWEYIGAARPDGQKMAPWLKKDRMVYMARVTMPDGKMGFMSLTSGKVYIPGVE